MQTSDLFLQGCGKTCKSNANVKSLGKYLFVEIDRSGGNSICDDHEDAKTISLYSLRLKPWYDISGHVYQVVGTVNYHLEKPEGGHYVTHFFQGSDEMIKVHEEEVRTVRLKPDHDTATVIVALQRKGTTAPVVIGKFILQEIEL